MKTSVKWIKGMEFNGVTPENSIKMDASAPLGKNLGPTPKELLALGLAGCTAMDVIALLKKHNQLPEDFTIDTEVETSKGAHPFVFKSAELTFYVSGNVNSAVLNEAVTLSQTKYCGVSAMLSKAFPVHYRVILNGKEVGSGSANFDSFTDAQVVS